MTSSRDAATGPGMGGEDAPEGGRADGATECPEESRRRGRDAEVAPLGGVLYRGDEDLADHAEAEPEHEQPGAGREL